MDDTGPQCVECLAPVSAAVHAHNGASLCPQCAAQFYRPCAGCGGLIPQDEAVLRDGALCCVQCLAAPVSQDDAAALSEEVLVTLVAEFIRLHAEAKQLNDRLDVVKEQLKRHAASQPRVANAVMLRTGEYAVKCGYSMRVSYSAEKLAAVEAMLVTEHFAALFARKITFSAVKEPLDAFLASEAPDTAAARAAILAAAERTEIATVAPVTSKRKLIVLASQALFTLMPADLDDYERGALWKHLRHACASLPLWTGAYGGYRLRVLTVQAL